MPKFLLSFGCCLAKSGSVGQWERQMGLGLNLLCVTGASDFISLGPRVYNYKQKKW